MLKTNLNIGWICDFHKTSGPGTFNCVACYLRDGHSMDKDDLLKWYAIIELQEGRYSRKDDIREC